MNDSVTNVFIIITVKLLQIIKPSDLILAVIMMAFLKEFTFIHVPAIFNEELVFYKTEKTQWKVAFVDCFNQLLTLSLAFKLVWALKAVIAF